MNEHIGIAMSKQSERMFYLYAAEPQLAVWDKTMNVESKSYAYFHLSSFSALINLCFKNLHLKQTLKIE